MNDFNRKVEDASARVGQTIGEAAERLEKEIPEFIKYLNDEVVPAVRTHSTKALRVASEKLAELRRLHGAARIRPSREQCFVSPPLLRRLRHDSDPFCSRSCW